jgi:dihydropteroate synthase
VTPQPLWRIRGGTIPLDRPVVFGIVNVTPDSFSDGGNFFSVDAAVARAGALIADGADVIDIGGESTRPGATAVGAADEIRRIGPVVRAVRAAHPATPLSIDTVKADVADVAIAAGAAIVNDVSGFRLDAGMASVCARGDVGVVLMHSRGGVTGMATYPATPDEDVTAAVLDALRARAAAARDAGIEPTAIVLDPGIGFGKRTDASLQLLADLPRLATLGYPLLVGVSRKRFIGEITGVDTAADRDEGTVGAAVAALARGARLFRVHDVRAVRRALDVAWAILRRVDDRRVGDARV